MHEYRRFIQGELDARGWRQADLVQKSGLSRQLISSIVNDDRDFLGQMPDEATLDGLATGLGVPVSRVRSAAARSLVGYVDSGEPLTPALQEVSLDALLNELRRRVEDRHADLPADTTQEPRAQGQEGEGEKTEPRNVKPFPRRRGRDFTLDPIVDMQGVAYNPPEQTDEERDTAPDPTEHVDVTPDDDDTP